MTEWDAASRRADVVAAERTAGVDDLATPSTSPPPSSARAAGTPGDRLDYGIERQRHTGFVGRDSVLAKLDRLLIADQTDRWVVVTGGPGMGKSAILAAWLSGREAAGAVVPHHFIRRGERGWDEPAKIMASLAAQIEALYPAERDPDARSESRLADLLTRVSARALAPLGGRLVILVDGLDEYDAPADAYSPLAALQAGTGRRHLPPARPGALDIAHVLKAVMAAATSGRFGSRTRSVGPCACVATRRSVWSQWPASPARPRGSGAGRRSRRWRLSAWSPSARRARWWRQPRTRGSTAQR